jgi:xanthine dehydrogenase accessory factor
VTVLANFLRQTLEAGEPAVLVTVTGAQGSTPREAGAAMLVAASRIAGTIGGGELEWRMIAKARDMILAGEDSAAVDLPLGPELGQCCGGRVALTLAAADRGTLSRLEAAEAAEVENWPAVLIFGAGHVGRALAAALAPLPLGVSVIDTRLDALAGLPVNVYTINSALPEAQVRDAPAGSGFVVVTHSHGLDFTITEAALARQDAAYVGMIGSRSKRAQFERWFAGQGGDKAMLERLVMPIGGRVRDKRPVVIAATAAAELAEHLLGESAGEDSAARAHPIADTG